MECRLGVKFSALWTLECSTNTCWNLHGGTNTGRNLACGTNTGRNFAYGTDRLRKEHLFAFILVLILQSDRLSTCLHLVIPMTTAALEGLGGDGREKIIHHLPRAWTFRPCDAILFGSSNWSDVWHTAHGRWTEEVNRWCFYHCCSKRTLMMLSNVCSESPALVCFLFGFVFLEFSPWHLCCFGWYMCIIQHYRIVSIHYVA